MNKPKGDTIEKEQSFERFLNGLLGIETKILPQNLVWLGLFRANQIAFRPPEPFAWCS